MYTSCTSADLLVTQQILPKLCVAILPRWLGKQRAACTLFAERRSRRSISCRDGRLEKTHIQCRWRVSQIQINKLFLGFLRLGILRLSSNRCNSRDLSCCIAWKRAPSSPKSSATTRKDFGRSDLAFASALRSIGTYGGCERRYQTCSTHKPLFAEPEWENHSCSWLLFVWFIKVLFGC